MLFVRGRYCYLLYCVSKASQPPFSLNEVLRCKNILFSTCLHVLLLNPPNPVGCSFSEHQWKWWWLATSVDSRSSLGPLNPTAAVSQLTTFTSLSQLCSAPALWENTTSPSNQSLISLLGKTENRVIITIAVTTILQFFRTCLFNMLFF